MPFEFDNGSTPDRNDPDSRRNRDLRNLAEERRRERDSNPQPPVPEHRIDREEGARQIKQMVNLPTAMPGQFRINEPTSKPSTPDTLTLKSPVTGPSVKLVTFGLGIISLGAAGLAAATSPAWAPPALAVAGLCLVVATLSRKKDVAIKSQS